MAFTLTIGSFDLTPYVRLGKEDGFDPYDSSGFEEPAFVDNPFGEGQALSNVDSRNREMVIPLYLNTSSKDLLHALVRDVNREIRYGAQPQRVTWKDQDATYSTFYDVEFARFDPSFSFRHSAQGWLAGTLRVWTKPFGHTGTFRVIGTSGATSQVGTYPVPSLAGDMDAQLRVLVGAASRSMLDGYPQTTILSALPYGWRPFRTGTLMFGGATARASGASNPVLSGASGAIASQVVEQTRAPAETDRDMLASTPVEAALVISEQIRVLALLSCDKQRPHYLQATLEGVAAATVTATPVASTGWLLADLGIIGGREADAFDGATSILDVTYGVGSWAATSITRLNALLLLPESRTAIVSAATTAVAGIAIAGVRSATEIVDGDSGRAFRHIESVAALGNLAREIPPFGQVPQVAPHASEALFVAQVHGGLVANNYQINTTVAVRERFTFAR